MSDGQSPPDAPASPCVQICVIHPAARICVGCLRSVDEISAWPRLSAEDRRAILAALPGRAPLLQKRRGGRAGRRPDLK